jgi:hypothetical protein
VNFINPCNSTAFVDLGRFFSFLIYTQSVRLLRLGIRPSQGRYLHTEQHKQNKRTQTPMPRVGFEPVILLFERAKTVHVLYRAATVIGPALAYPFLLAMENRLVKSPCFRCMCLCFRLSTLNQLIFLLILV